MYSHPTASYLAGRFYANFKLSTTILEILDRAASKPDIGFALGHEFGGLKTCGKILTNGPCGWLGSIA